MASLKDIAERCKVSVATVSKALNDQKDIGEETKKRVMQVAKEMGYKPNVIARALKTGKTMNLGVLFADDAQNGLTHDYFSQVLDAFKRTAEAKGYDITFINNQASSYLQHAKERGFDGILIACSDYDSPRVLELVQGDIPIVTVDYIFNNHTAVLSNNVEGMRELTEYVIQQGHRRIAYVHGENSLVTKARLSAFLRVVEEAGFEIPEEYLVEGAFRNVRLSHEATERLLKLKNPPTCILYSDDLACMGGMNALTEAGIRIPLDMSIAGYDGVRNFRYLEPKLTTVEQDTEDMGRIAAEKLIEVIEKPRTAMPEQIVVNGHLIKGATIKELV